MKNLTLSMDEETYKRARMAAAERGVSMSALVREYFRGLRPEPKQHEENVRELFEAMDTVKGTSASGRERNRARLYDR
jgi:hypothetical protein